MKGTCPIVPWRSPLYLPVFCVLRFVGGAKKLSVNTPLGFLASCPLLILGLLLGTNAPYANAQSTAPITETIDIDSNAPAQEFPHWERMFGSGRAILTLRESYRNESL